MKVTQSIGAEYPLVYSFFELKYSTSAKDRQILYIDDYQLNITKNDDADYRTYSKNDSFYSGADYKTT